MMISMLSLWSSAPRPAVRVRMCASSSSSSSAAAAADFGSDYHLPVMCSEAVEWLIGDRPTGTFVDATLGGGGHSAALLEKLAPHGGHLIGVDRDPDALAAAGARLESHIKNGHATLVRSNFGALSEALRGVSAGALAGDGAPRTGVLDGILVDLGVSSHQLDDAARGFSFMRDGPLDMRMDQQEGAASTASSSSSSSLTAEVILNEWTSEAIANTLWKYGEERESRRIARAIVAARPLHTTSELANVLRTAGSKREPKEVTKRYSRVFQALRIEVNAELSELEAILNTAGKLIKPGGRLAVMSYHSLEDRRVKRLLRSGSFHDEPPPQDMYGNVLAPWKTLTRRAVVAGPAELERNPRARSARLRVGERTEFPMP